MGLEIVYSDWALANRYDDTIELHKDLKKYKRLHDWLLKHELEHEKEFNLVKDTIHDYGEIPPASMLVSMVRFMAPRPKTWIQLLPFGIFKGEIYWDVSMIIFWLLLFIFSGTIIMIKFF